MPNNLKKMETIHVQCIKFETPHKQYLACHPVPSIDDDVRRLTSIALWSQKNDTPHNAVKPTISHNK
jgi:hypothetical protein